jgi:hypothetical protein
MDFTKSNPKFKTRDPMIELKAKLLCKGAKVDGGARKLFELQNPSNVKRGGLSSGGKIKLENGLFVNFPFYQRVPTSLSVVKDPARAFGVLIQEQRKTLSRAEALQAPEWYKETVRGFPITLIFTAHNRQLAAAVFEDCALFGIQKECKFCVINRSLSTKPAELVIKSPELMLEALTKIPKISYDGITLNGGMTLKPSRGMEIVIPVVAAIRENYPDVPIAVEMTPPSSIEWVDKFWEAGGSSLMMNLEVWDEEIRKKVIPGKDEFCPKESYMKAFERAVSVLGPGKTSTCFVVGAEPIDTLKEGIERVVEMGVVPSPLAGRYFEDIPNYPFNPRVDWRDFLDVLEFAAGELAKKGLRTMDKAGCVACKMCDLIKDIEFAPKVKKADNPSEVFPIRGYDDNPFIP